MSRLLLVGTCFAIVIVAIGMPLTAREGRSAGTVAAPVAPAPAGSCPTDDTDCDGVPDAADNCPFLENPDQENNDRNFIGTTPLLTQDDTSRAMSDGAGDECDDDDDNDGLIDFDEMDGPLGSCSSTTGTLDPIHPDSDGDGAMDGAECAIGTNPRSFVSKPSASQCAALLGAGVAADTDGDQILDRVETCGYGTSATSIDSDGDGATDGCEVASLNTLPAVNSGDQLLLSQAIIFDLQTPALGWFVWNADLNKDGANNSGDQLLIANIIMVGGCPTAPPAPPTPTPTPAPNTPTPTLTSQCFAGETQISMADGSTRRIDQLAVGDAVLAYDVEAGRAIEGRVADVYARTSATHLLVRLANGSELRVTPEHPFFDPATGEYREIKTFEVGDALALGGGDGLATTAIASVKTVHEPLTVYNLHVDVASHNYFANGVLVHNKTPTHTPTATPTP